MMFENVEEIRKALIQQFPDVNDDQFSIQHSGFVHDHPMIPIGVILISSAMLGTTDTDKLTQFTGYSKRFVQGISINMENSSLWKKGKYNSSSWFAGGLVPNKEPEISEFWEHVMIAEGSLCEHGTNPNAIQSTCSIFWGDMLEKARERGVMMWRSGKRVI
jgi:hypothetical protein